MEGAEAETAGAVSAAVALSAVAVEPPLNLRRPGDNIEDRSPKSPLEIAAPLTGAVDDAAMDGSNGGAVGSGMRESITTSTNTPNQKQQHKKRESKTHPHKEHRVCICVVNINALYSSSFVRSNGNDCQKDGE